MKKAVALTALLIAALGISIAQGSLKVGHVNTQELLNALPEWDSVQSELTSWETDVKNTLEEMQVNFRVEYEKYMQIKDTLSPMMRQVKEENLMNLQTRADEFQRTMQTKGQQMSLEMLNPIILKVKETINEVAQENNFTYVFEATEGGGLLYASGTDIKDLVLAKLKAK